LQSVEVELFVVIESDVGIRLDETNPAQVTGKIFSCKLTAKGFLAECEVTEDVIVDSFVDYLHII
jgi:hypothetical protein